ncbi:MAG TPA: hypothetical protein VKR06_43490 [Ktedonosporobacter sp.]|nr:hypothetical protein [Ktedonosporobacter sp.]
MTIFTRGAFPRGLRALLGLICLSGALLVTQGLGAVRPTHAAADMDICNGTITTVKTTPITEDYLQGSPGTGRLVKGSRLGYVELRKCSRENQKDRYQSAVFKTSSRLPMTEFMYDDIKIVAWKASTKESNARVTTHLTTFGERGGDANPGLEREVFETTWEIPLRSIQACGALIYRFTLDTTSDVPVRACTEVIFPD